ncbi:MAG: lipid-A-disaccharide synthase [Deltaproteobacteria bacterium]|nr:lipid-A-disaccharide synthase [Deltaproteobacteria bacterium]
MADSEKRVLIVAGEASADLHGAHLVRAIQRLAPGVRFWGIGGDRMGKAGVDILTPSSDMAVVGLTEVFSRLGTIAGAFFRLRSFLKRARPDLLILMDYPDFNLHLAGSARRFGVPILYYIGPQVWAWRRGRVRKIAARVDRMAVILPFEEPFYRGHGIRVDYVGHPLLDAVPRDLDREGIRAELGIGSDRPVLGLLPGSRSEEVRNLLPVMVAAAEILLERYPNLRCVLPVASTISLDLIMSLLGPSPVPVTPTRGDIYDPLSLCDMAFVASGTATLETAIMEVPMVVVYRVSPVSYWIGKRVVRVPHISLVNLVAEEEIVPELIQDGVTPANLAREALSILEDPHRKGRMLDRFRDVTLRLGKGGSSERTARIALEMMA